MTDNWSDPYGTTPRPPAPEPAVAAPPPVPQHRADPYATPAPDSDGSSSTTDTAKEQASQVAGTTKDAGRQVAGEAKTQAQNVAGEAKTQAKDVLHRTRGELRTQAGEQQQRVAGGLRSISSELGQMAGSADQPGPAADVAQQVSSRVDAVADWLEQREPGQVLEDVQQFARQRPGAFLAIAAGAGLLVGRLARGLKDDATDDAPSAPAPSSSAPSTTSEEPSSETAWAAPIAAEQAYGDPSTTVHHADGVPSDVPVGVPTGLDPVEPSRYPR